MTRLLLNSFFISLLFHTGCKTTSDLEKVLIPRFMIESRGTEYGALRGSVMKLPYSKMEIVVDREPVISELDIINVELVKVELGLALLIELNDTGARALYRTSVTNKGNRLVFTVNNKAIGARRLDQAINDGKLYTFVEVREEEMGQLVLDLKASLSELRKR